MSRTHCGTKGKGLATQDTQIPPSDWGRSLCADTLQLGFAAARLVGSAGGGGRLEIWPQGAAGRAGLGAAHQGQSSFLQRGGQAKALRVTTTLGLASLSFSCLLTDRAKCTGDPVIEEQLRLVIITFFFCISKEPLISVEGQAWREEGAWEACLRPALTDGSSVVWGLGGLSRF